MDIIVNKKIFFSSSGFLVVLSIILALVFGLRQGIDLAGGASWKIKIPDQGISEQAVADLLTSQTDLSRPGGGYQNISVRQEVDVFTIRLPDIKEEDHQKYLAALKERFSGAEELSFESIGPSVGGELRRRSFWAAGLVLLGISLYVAYAFRKVSRPVNSWKYGLITLLTLAHDVIIPIGLLAFLGWWKAIEIDTNFIVALLVIMGFSVHDTIVVFDRIRENLLVYRGGKKLAEIINLSIKETFVRSVNTSLTLVLVLLMLLFFGPEALFYFILTVLVGTIVGTYSSIFIASPLLLVWSLEK